MNLRIQTMPSGSRPLTGSSNNNTFGSPNNAPANPRRCDIPNENPPAFLPATSDNPTNPSTSSTRDFGIPFEAAIHCRCARALRFGCTHFASNNAPTVRSGVFSSRYGLPSINAAPDVG
ncbi:hypothetical protein BKP42_68560 [Rhodococcus erythropolis]|nr:hypothetical protein BKP42_68560 [Rhodococcus erythropolis]